MWTMNWFMMTKYIDVYNIIKYKCCGMIVNNQ